MFKHRKQKALERFTIIVISVIISTMLMLFSSHLLPSAFAADPFILRSTQQVYVPGDVLLIYGAATPNEILVIRLYDPSGLVIRIENVPVDEDGYFRQGIFEWPEPSRNLSFGLYTVEAVSSKGARVPQSVEVSFAEAVEQITLGEFPKTHILATKMDSPSQVTINSEFRIFIQVTFDGVLVDAENDAAVAGILGTSHIHSSNSTIILNDKFRELHPGLYFADVQLDKEDTYIIHAVAFYKGFLSHDSRVVTVTGSSIGTIQDSVNDLDTQLDATHQDLEALQERLDETRSALNDTKSAITGSVEGARTSIRDEIRTMEQASGQINSIILPVLALISVIIALQISLFARIRASYK